MLTVNGRTYRPPAVPTVVVCVDGCEPDYLAQAVAGGHMPWLKRTLAQGSGLVADCVVPTFTNPNNLSIVTGAPPSVHGICGNYLFDTATALSSFYEQCPVLKSEGEVRTSRLAICAATRTVLGKGLDLLGIVAPDRM